MKRKFTFLMTALLIMFSYAGLAQVVSGTTYSTPSVTGLPDGWSGEDGDGTTYMKLIAAEHYIQTANFEQNGFTSITVKARKYGGPSAAQAQISVSWYGSENEETVLGTIDPTNTTLTDYTINGPATTTSGTGYVKIQCKGASANKGSGVSEVTITYTEPGGTTPTIYTVTYNANVTGVASIVDNYTEGANVTLRDANTFTNDGHTFNEWNTQADGDGDPYDAGEVIENIQANIELYAIWTENPVSDEQWVLTNLADLTENDVFVIVGNNGSNYAMANDKGTTNPPTAVSVTIANEAITSTVTANIQWNISGNATDGYVFYPNGDAESWLYCTNTNNGVRVGTNEANTFNMEASSGYLVHQGTSRYVGIYNSESWRCYTSINTNIQNQTFAFYKKVTGGVIPPSITAENVSIEYNATSGSIAYTINNGVDGGTISAAVTEGDWLTLGEGTTSPISFTCSANEAGTGRTATVTLTYTYDRATATANVTVTQAGNPNIVNNISDITATSVDYAIIGTIVAKSARGLVFGDGTGYVYYYNPSYTQDDYNIGDIKKISGTMGSYNHVFQFTSTATIEAAENSNYNNTPAIQVLDATGIAAYNSNLHLSDYVQIEGTLVKSGNYYNLQITGLETTASIAYPTTTQAEELNALENKTIRVKGYFAGVSSGHFNVVMESIEEVASTEPAIILDTYEIEVPAEGGEGTINVTYQNLEVTTDNTAVYFCAEDGSTYTTYDWITAEIDANYNVHYVVEANQGAARTAYFRVETGVAPEEEEDLKVPNNGGGFLIDYSISDLVIVSQEAYVAPTFAELPFEFDGGRAAIDTIDGLYQEGLGSDYNNSPKLKFDSTDDYLLLQFNEEPGTLTFDIKGNSFSGGTFTVQTSEDGVTYTDLETYTELSATQHELFDDLGENVRYIKWIYTEKSSGNVALGNITLAQPAASVASITINPDVLNLDATMHAVELLPLTYENLEITGLYNFTTQFYDAEGEAIEDPEWCSANVVPITNGDGYQVHIMTQANEGEVRSAYFKVYVLDANENPVYSNLVTINQAAPVIDYAVLPFVWEGGSSADFAALNGVTLSGNGSDYGSNNAPYLIKLDGTGDYIMVKTDSQPGIVTIGVKMIGGGNTSTITVQGSADGETFTDIEELTISGDQNDILTLETTNAFGDNDRYVKLLFTKGSNVGVGPITIANGSAPSITITPATLDLEAEIQVPSMDVTYHNLEITQANNFNVQFYDAEGEEQDMPNWIYYTNVSGPLPLDGSYRVFSMIMANDGPARSAYFKVYAYDADSIAVYSNLVTINQAGAQYTLTVEPFENLEMFTFVGEESEMALEGAGSIQVAAGDNVMLSISALEGYEIASLMVDGEEHVQDIDESMVYLFDMPGHDVTISATAVEITPVTYTLATTIESGKTYIIVGSKTINEETTYYAMGEQRNNNRGGVAISADGTTATVTSADVYEFIITALEDGFYSIYDDRTPGYLYAAASGSNYLRTEPELDTVGNGNWEISIDEEGLFSIVASQSNNRNMMQFNYNGGSPLFSCYGSASQSPVYLYVKDETPSTVTQTIALIAGTNWISANVEITLADLQEALVAALPGTTITIKSKNQQTAYNGSRWRGQLNTLDLTQMYKVIVSSACEITLEGMPIDPAEHSITIEANNANWIAFPLGANMTVSDAFAGFAVNGDQIKYKDAQTAYNGSRWRGSLSNLVPGQGYIYISNSSENRVFVFPTSSKK